MIILRWQVKIVLDKAIMLLNEFTKEHPFKVFIIT